MTADLAEVVRAARHDEAAFVVLVERFSGMVWAIARSFQLARADAADVSQAVWLRLATHLHRIEHPEAIAGWIRTTAHHECLALLRRDRLVRSGADVADWPDDRLPPLDVGLVQQERHRALWDAFSSLPARCQALLRLLLTDPPLSYDDIAEVLGMPRGSIGPTRQRCIDRLREHPAVARIRDPAERSSSPKASP